MFGSGEAELPLRQQTAPFQILDQCAAEVATTINLMLDVGFRLFAGFYIKKS